MSDIFQRISIPKPCHEDWNKMTPDQKGAFCKVCNKSVHDFSRKSAEEVEQILLKEEEGKVCGRFRSDQIVMPKDLEIPLHMLPRNISPFRAFALAVFIVFGTALFGITDASGQGLKGKVCIKPPVKETPVKKPDVNKDRHMIRGDVAVEPAAPVVPEPKREEVMGKVKCVNPKTPEPTIELREEPHKVGEVMIYKKPDPEVVKSEVMHITGDTIISPRHQPAELKAVEIPLVQTEPILMVQGGVSMVSSRTESEIVTVTHHQVEKVADTVKTEDKPVTRAIGGIKDPIFAIPDTSMPAMILGQMVMRLDPLPLEVLNPEILPDSEVHKSQVDSVIHGTTLETREAALVSEKQTPALNGSADGLSCFPNPTNGQTFLKYTISKRCDVLVEVYNMLGSRVKTLVQISNHYEGQYNTGIDLSELPNGEYIIRMQAGDSVMGTRVVVDK